MKGVSLTLKRQERWEFLAIGYSGGIRNAVLPQVGEVGSSGQDSLVEGGEVPVFSGQGGTHQGPPQQTDHEAADLHVHHRCPVLHCWQSDRGHNCSPGEG